VGAADPVSDLSLAVVVPAGDRPDRLAVEFDRLGEDRRRSPLPRPTRLEGGAIMRVSGREGGHPEGVVVGPVLKEDVEIAVGDVAEQHHHAIVGELPTRARRVAACRRLRDVGPLGLARGFRRARVESGFDLFFRTTGR